MIYKELLRKKHVREDGWLSELISIKYEDDPFNCLHSYLVLINPGETRAEHYHKKKEEWLAITSGKIMVLLEDIHSNKREKIILDINSKDYKLIYLPPLVAHAIKNIGDKEASIVVFSTILEDPDDTIPYKFEVT